MDIDQLATTIGKQFVTAWNAPVPFLAAILAGWFLLRWFLKSQFETRLTNAQSTLALRDAQLQDYKDKLSGATPDEAKARMDALESRLDEIGPQIAALGPRRVSAEQRQAMVPILDRCKGAQVSIASDAASSDAAQMSKGMVAAFHSAAWHVRTPMVMGLGFPPPTGIALRVHDLAMLSEQEQCIADALKAAGLEFDLQKAGGAMTIPGESITEIILTTRLHD